MRDTYSIGEVAKITGFSINALRLYDRMNLIKPMVVNKKSNYRYYHRNQIFFFNIIRLAKDLGMPLEELKVLFKKGDLTTLDEFFDTLTNNMENKIETLKQDIVDIENIKIQMAVGRTVFQENGLYKRSLEERTVLLNNLPEKNAEKHIYKETVKIESYINENHLRPTYEEGVLYKYQDQLTPFAIYKGIFLNFDTNTTNVQVLPAGTYLCLNYSSDNKDEAFALFCNTLIEYGIKDSLVVDMHLINDVYNYENYEHELQAFIGEL